MARTSLDARQIARGRTSARTRFNRLEVMERFRLDFDDSYQYTAAEKRNLTIVSFDGDFDGTDRGRTTPAEMLNSLQKGGRLRRGRGEGIASLRSQ